MGELPDADPLYVVCRSGGRSARVVAYLARPGLPGGERRRAGCRPGPRRAARSSPTVAAPRRSSRPRASGATVGSGARQAPWVRLPTLRAPGPRRGRSVLPVLRPLPGRPALGGRAAARRHAAATGPGAATRYTGPPRYRLLPRWGFPLGPWTPQEPAPASPDPLFGARSLVGSLVPLLWATTAVALLAAGAEVWRYVLLLASRDGALAARSGRSLRRAGGVGRHGRAHPRRCWSACCWCCGPCAPHRPRPTGPGCGRPAPRARSCSAGSCPGSTSRCPDRCWPRSSTPRSACRPDRRPRPSRLLLVWWALWVASVVLAVVVLLWSLRDGVQARADGVVLHAVLDLLAAVTAGVTARLVAAAHPAARPRPAPRRSRACVVVGALGPAPLTAAAPAARA